MYKLIQEEYEELKDKVKYIGDKLLGFEKKDNEIKILRREDNILKKEVDKLERINKQNENFKKLKKINDLQNEIQNVFLDMIMKYIIIFKGIISQVKIVTIIINILKILYIIIKDLLIII